MYLSHKRKVGVLGLELGTDKYYLSPPIKYWDYVVGHLYIDLAINHIWLFLFLENFVQNVLD